MSIWTDIQNKFHKGDIVVRLVLINLAVFILINIYLLVLYVSDTPAIGFLGKDLAMAASSSWKVMLHRPWSIVTHMFAHENFGHLLFNMIAIYFMGNLLKSMLGSKSVFTTYIMGGLSGLVLFFLFYNLSPKLHTQGGSLVLGASAAAMAITCAAAAYAPRMQIFLFGAFKLELQWLAIFMVLLDLVSIRSGVNSGGHIGHIGGAIFGYLYATQLRKGNNMFLWFDKLIDRLKILFTRKNRMKVSVNHARPKSDELFNLEKKERQKKVDTILDKIGRSGYDSLSKDEKEFLFKHSQK
jgi:membrane associated rhomboid family serine protease